jgi:uncharacterized membrane protein
MHIVGFGRLFFAVGMIGLGVVGLLNGDFAMDWQQVPIWIPGREGLAYASAVVMLTGGIGLLWGRSAPLASRVLLAYLLLWFLLIRVVPVAITPTDLDAWGGVGENGIMLAGCLVLFAAFGTRLRGSEGLTKERTVQIAKVMFGIALLLCSISHFVFAGGAAKYWVPPWLPWHLGWVYLSGAGWVAAGIGVLFGIYPRLSAAMVVAMTAAFTALDWGLNAVGSHYAPALLPEPTSVTTRWAWTGLFISWSITAGAWIVADSYRGTPWLAVSSLWAPAPPTPVYLLQVPSSANSGRQIETGRRKPTNVSGASTIALG